MQNGGDRIEILLVEDNAEDIELIREALSSSTIKSTVHVVTDGEAALDFLYRRGRRRDAVRPDLVLLDIGLPRRDGKEVLEIIKKDPELKKIPVVMFTGSASEKDVLKSYQLQANGYVRKPPTLAAFVETIKALEEFWLGVVKLPRSG
jgi:CheY-like chemotaxis protein